MTDRAGKHRNKPLVLQSIEREDAAVCVDLFRRADGSFGFELYRRDAEDPRGWHPAGGFAALSFASEAEARRAAREAVPWLAEAPPRGSR